MKKSHSIIGILAGILISFFILLGMNQDPSSTTAISTPNIVLILVDDLDAGMSEYWTRVDELKDSPLSNCDTSKVTAEMTCDPLRKTRTLIKNQGITFKNAFTSTALCCPSRASIETGKYAHNTGVITNGGDVGGYEAFVNHGNLDKTIAVQLQAAGYRTAILGKYLHAISDITDVNDYPIGWSDMYLANSATFYMGYDYTLFEKSHEQICNTVAECTKSYGTDTASYSTDVLANKAVNFINDVAQSKTSQPFFLYVSPTAPHFPIPPAMRHQHHPYTNAVINRAFWPNFKEADVSDKPDWLQISVPARNQTIDKINNDDYRLRQGSLYAVDDLVEKIYNALKTHHLLDNTYIVFASDNGYNLGAHYLIHKMSGYDESTHIPMVIRGPNIPPGKINENLVLALDLPVTFAALAGLDTSDNKSSPQYDGLSLMPLFNTDYSSSWRTDFLSEYVLGAFLEGIGEETPPAFWWLIGQEVPSYRSVRTHDFSYIKWYHGQDLAYWDEAKQQLVWDVNPNLPSAEELYDLKNDPFQLDNLLAKEDTIESCKSIVKILNSRMEQLSVCKGETCRASFKYPENDIHLCSGTKEKASSD